MRFEEWMVTIGADAIERWKRGEGYDALEALIERDETIVSTLLRTPTPIDTSGIVSSVLLSAYESADDALMLLLNEANASALHGSVREIRHRL